MAWPRLRLVKYVSPWVLTRQILVLPGGHRIDSWDSSLAENSGVLELGEYRVRYVAREWTRTRKRRGSLREYYYAYIDIEGVEPEPEAVLLYSRRGSVRRARYYAWLLRPGGVERLVTRTEKVRVRSRSYTYTKLVEVVDTPWGKEVLGRRRTISAERVAGATRDAKLKLIARYSKRGLSILSMPKGRIKEISTLMERMGFRWVPEKKLYFFEGEVDMQVVKKFLEKNSPYEIVWMNWMRILSSPWRGPKHY